MDNHLLQQCANGFRETSDYQFKFLLEVPKSKDQISVIVNFQPEEFIHIVGIEHLPTIQKKANKKAAIKRSIYKEILKGNYPLDTLQQEDKVALSHPIALSYNPATQQEYTITDRIKKLTDINSLFLNGFSGSTPGRIYNWKASACKIQIPNSPYKFRTSSITNAQYLLILQSPDHPSEKINFFMAGDKIPVSEKARKQTIKNPLHFTVISAFPDGLDFSLNQGKPFYTLKVDMVSSDISKSKNLYTSERIDTSPSLESSPNIKNIQFTAPDILPSPTGAAAIPSPMDNLVKGLSDAAEKLHNFFASFLPKPKRSSRPRTSVKAEHPRSPEQSEPESKPPRQDAPKAFAVRRSQIKELAGKQAETPHIQRSKDKKQNIEQ